MVMGAVLDGPAFMLGASRAAKTATYQLLTSDRGATIDCTSGTYDITALASSVLGSGYHAAIYNSGSGTVTFNPAGTETVRSPAGTATTFALSQGQGIVVMTDGANWDIIASTGIAPSSGTVISGLTTSRIVDAASATTVETAAALSTDQSLTTTSTLTSKASGAAGIRLDHNSATGNFVGALEPMNLTATRRWRFADASLIMNGSTAGITTNILGKGTAVPGVMSDSTITDTGALITFGSATTQATNWAQTGATTGSTGTGSWSLNGDTTLAADKRLGIGSLSAAAMVNIGAAQTALSGASQHGYRTAMMGSSAATTRIVGFDSEQTTAAASFTTGDLVQFGAWQTLTLGAASTATRSIDLYTRARTIGTNNAGIYHGSATTGSFTGNWFIYNEAGTQCYLGTGPVYIGSAAAINTDEVFQALKSTSATNAVTPGLVAGANSTGTAAAGFGVSKLWTLESTTTNNTSAALEEVLWATATHASRKARRVFSIYDTAVRECMRMEADGSNPMIGFLGANAVARQTVTGSRGGNAALASLLTALATEGLITDSTTA